MELGRAVGADTFRLERTLNAPIERVWAYFVDAEKRSRWFTAGDDLTTGGQAFTFMFGHHRITNEEPPERWAEMKDGDFPMQGRVLAFEPPHLLAITWGDGGDAVSEVRFEFSAEGEKTRLVLTHSKIESDKALRNYAGGWTAHLETLEHLLSGKETNRFWADVVAAHAAYETQL